MALASSVTEVSSTITLNSRTHHRHPFAHLPNEEISILTGYSGLLLTISMVIIFLIKHYLLEAFLFPRFYRRVYNSMDDGLKRGFLNHHIAAGTKLVLLIVGAKPWLDVLFRRATLTTPMGRGEHPTMGDILIVLTQLYVAMYLFELFFRRTLSYVAVLHHVGAVVIAETAVVLSLDLAHERDATVEFVLCLVWGRATTSSTVLLNLLIITFQVHSMFSPSSG